MMYLQIHRVLYAILCLLCFIIQFIVYIAVAIIYFLWSFKITEYSEFFNCCDAHYKGINTDTWCFHNHYDARSFVDKNPKETILRYYHYMF